MRMTWKQVFNRIVEAPGGKLYGVPRGGAIVAGLTGRAVDDPIGADAIVDDIVDSGKTRGKYLNQFGKGIKFWPLIDADWRVKNKVPPHEWIVFPWETHDPLADMEDNVIRQLQFMGEDPNRDGLLETPRRVVKAISEMTAGYKQDPRVILSKTFDVPYDEMVILRDIEFWSLCEHHMLPFHGKVHIGYLPDKKVVGISKLARVVDVFARRLQVQERMTQQIAESIETALKPKGVGVIVHATHLCMAMRGVQKPADMVTSCLLGVIREGGARSEFLKLAHDQNVSR